MNATKHIHVTPRANSGWNVVNEKQPKPVATTLTQAQAIQIATNQAKVERCDVIIHGQDGKIRERHSYGNDPYPPKG